MYIKNGVSKNGVYTTLHNPHCVGALGRARRARPKGAPERRARKARPKGAPFSLLSRPLLRLYNIAIFQ